MMLLMTELESGLSVAAPKSLVFFVSRAEGLILGTKVLTGIPSGGLPFTQLTVKESPEELIESSEGTLILLTDMTKRTIGMNPGVILLVHKSKDELIGSRVLTSLPNKKNERMSFDVYESVEKIVTLCAQAMELRQAFSRVTKH